MDPQNAQFYSLFVAPDLIFWKVQELKDRAQGMTEDEILHAYREIQYIASSAVSTSDHVKQVRRSGGTPPSLPPPDDVGVDSVETESEPKSRKPASRKKAKPTKKRKRQAQPSPEVKAQKIRESGPLSRCPNPQAMAVRVFRWSKLMSQRDFGEAIGVHPVTVAQYERGTMRITEYFVDKIITAFPELNRTDVFEATFEDFADELAKEGVSVSDLNEAQGGQS